MSDAQDPRDSAQLPFPHHPEHAMTWMDSEKRVIQAYAEAYAREALRAQAASVEPVAWRLAYAAFRGAFDTPVARRQMNCEYAQDARKRLSEINEALTAPPAHIPADVEARVSKVEDGGHEFTTGDDDLDLLLGLTTDIADDNANMDTGVWWLQMLETVKARLAPQPQAVAASSPATAVDAVVLTDQQIVGFLEAAGVEFQSFMGGIAGTKHIHATAGSQDVSKILVGFRAALQASRQPVTQQAGGEGAGPSDAERWQFVMDWGNKDFAVCKRVGVTGTCWEPIKTSGPVDFALATKEQRS